MSQKVTEKGKTVDEAVEKALAILSATRDQVDIDVVQEPEGGVLGIFGKKDAIVDVTLKDAPAAKPSEEAAEVAADDAAEADAPTAEDEAAVEAYTEAEEQDVTSAAKEFLSGMFAAMDMDVTIDCDYDEAESMLRINLSGDKMGLLIGRRGQTLDAIQYLTSLTVNKHTDRYVRVLINTEHYREKRQKTLENLAHKMAGKAVRYGRKISLEPMNPGERRIIHAALQDDDRVYTFSKGQDPHRHVVIDLKENQIDD